MQLILNLAICRYRAGSFFNCWWWSTISASFNLLVSCAHSFAVLAYAALKCPSFKFTDNLCFEYMFQVLRRFAFSVRWLACSTSVGYINFAITVWQMFCYNGWSLMGGIHCSAHSVIFGKVIHERAPCRISQDLYGLDKTLLSSVWWIVFT